MSAKNRWIIKNKVLLILLSVMALISCGMSENANSVKHQKTWNNSKKPFALGKVVLSFKEASDISPICTMQANGVNIKQLAEDEQSGALGARRGFFHIAASRHLLHNSEPDTTDISGINLFSDDTTNTRKLLMSIVLIVALLILRWLLAALTRYLMENYRDARATFWVRQVVNIILVAVLFFGIVLIWIGNPSHLTEAMALVSAGLAFALQKPITALAGYLVILRGRTFHVGERIRMGGVSGDVIRVGFIQTAIMEMGQPPGEQGDDPSMWVKARQFSGRIVTVSNSKIFNEPVYNYTRDFPYLWEEIMIPITYTADRATAESILLEAANRHSTKTSQVSTEALHKMQEAYFVKTADFEPRVFYRLTDNWLELSLRFVVPDRGVRGIKDAMSREIITAFDEAGIGIASATYDIVGFPPVRVRRKTD